MVTPTHEGVADTASRLFVALRDLRNAIAGEVDEGGLDYHDVRILLTLRNGASSPGTLLKSKWLSGSHTNLSYRLTQLEKSGYINRKRDLPNDRRRSSVTLTPKGQAVAARANTVMASFEERIGGLFTTENLRALQKGLDAPVPRLARAS